MLHVKKKALSAAFISALLISGLASALLNNQGRFAFAQVPWPYPSVTVSVQLPENTVYYQNSVPVAFTVTGTLESYSGSFGRFIGFTLFSYSLDGEAWISFSPWPTQTSSSRDYHQFRATLTELTNGNHSLKIIVEADFQIMLGVLPRYCSSDWVSFAINAPTTSTPVRILILSGENSVYGTNAVSMPLNFTVDKPVSWVGYRVDNNALVPLTNYAVLPQYSFGPNTFITTTDNKILMGLAEGSHKLILYINDTAGNTGQSDALNFTVAQEAQPQQTPSKTQQPNPESFPTTWIAAAAVSVVVVIAGLIFYLRKRKH